MGKPSLSSSSCRESRVCPQTGLFDSTLINGVGNSFFSCRRTVQSLQVPTVQTTPEYRKTTHHVIILYSFTCIHVHFALISPHFFVRGSGGQQSQNIIATITTTPALHLIQEKKQMIWQQWHCQKTVQGTYGLMMRLEGSLSYNTKQFHRMEKAPKTYSVIV